MSRLSVSWLHRTALIYTLVAFAVAIEKTCSPISQLAVIENSRLTGAVFDTVVSSGVVACAKECLSRLACKSFNFHLDDGTCELNSEDVPRTDGTVAVWGMKRFVFSPSQIWPQGILGACNNHNCPLNTRCVDVGRNASKCVVTYSWHLYFSRFPWTRFQLLKWKRGVGFVSRAQLETRSITFNKTWQIHQTDLEVVPWTSNCPDPPAIEHATATSPISHVTPVNQTLQMKCIVGYVPCGNVTCKSDGTWTNMSCKSLSRCKHVLELNANYDDGEYWLYPQPLNGDRVKVYCHDMKNTSREYITLTTPYIMDAPFITNYHCTGNDAFAENNFLGKHVFSKFGLDMQTMAIFKGDRRFYNKTGVNTADVGLVKDCYSNNCGPVGRAVIDLRGTGLSVSGGVTWKKYAGWTPIVNRFIGGQLIEIRCGGYCGGCSVSGSLSLSLMTSDAPAENSATIPTCAP